LDWNSTLLKISVSPSAGIKTVIFFALSINRYSSPLQKALLSDNI
jgi:hypothetical protein